MVSNHGKIVGFYDGQRNCLDMLERVSNRPAISAAAANALMAWAEKRIMDRCEAFMISGKLGTRKELEIHRHSLSAIIGREECHAIAGCKQSSYGLMDKSKLVSACGGRACGCAAADVDHSLMVPGRLVTNQRTYAPPLISILVMDEGDEFKEHEDECRVTANIPLGGTFTGGEFSLRLAGKLRKQELKPRHLHAHLGNIRHKVNKVTSGRRFSLIMHYDVRGMLRKSDSAVGIVVRNNGSQKLFMPALHVDYTKHYLGSYASFAEAASARQFAQQHGVAAAKAKYPSNIPQTWTKSDLAKLRNYVNKHRRNTNTGRIDWSKWCHPTLTARQATTKRNKLGW